MVKGSFVSNVGLLSAMLVATTLLAAPAVFAAEEAPDAAQAVGNISVGAGIRALGIALAAALCVAGGAFATGRAQSAIGAGGTGAMAEKPELFGRVFILVALPETMVVLGFVLGIVIALNL